MDAPEFVNRVGDTVMVDDLHGSSDSVVLNLTKEEQRFFRSVEHSQIPFMMGILNKCAEKGFQLGKISK